MCKRTIIALLLISLMSYPATSGTRIQQEDEQDQDLSVLPYDRYDAERIARTFKEELEKGNDISPLIDKYFVSDFDERFAREAAERYWFPAKPKAIALADKKDVRRFYVALVNFEFLYLRLATTLEKQEKEKLIAAGARADVEIDEVEKLFPKDVIDAFSANKYLSDLISNDAKDEPVASTDVAAPPVEDAAIESEKEPGALEHEIRTLEQLRDLSSTMEIAAARMRDYLDSLPAELTTLNYIMPIDDETGAAHPSYGVSEEAAITREESFYGVPVGTRLVCAGVFNLHIDMIRIDGELKVLAVYMPISD